MGIDVSADKVVKFNNEHQLRVNTDPSRQVYKQALENFSVVSIFRRRRASNDNHDGNPLVYALKGKKGFSIPRRDFQNILENAFKILPSALDESPRFDVVIPIPSSSNISKILARRVVRSSPGSHLLECLEKCTVSQALARMPDPDDIPSRLRGGYTELINTFQSLSPNSIVEMKHIKLRLRPYVSPIAGLSSASCCAGLRVMLVDDIVGSGTSLMAGVAALEPFGPASLSGLTFMSRLH